MSSKIKQENWSLAPGKKDLHARRQELGDHKDSEGVEVFELP